MTEYTELWTPEKQREANRKYRERHPDRARESWKKWRDAHKEELTAYNRAHQETLNRLNHRYIENHPGSGLAWHTVRKMLRSGATIKPAVCPKCGRGGRMEAHHKDYARPDIFIWLCHKCHRETGATK